MSKRVTRWFGLSETVLDELLLTGRATVFVDVDGHVEHLVLSITDDDDVDVLYRTEQ